MWASSIHIHAIKAAALRSSKPPASGLRSGSWPAKSKLRWHRTSFGSELVSQEPTLQPGGLQTKGRLMKTPPISRRLFLRSSAAALGSGVVGAACGSQAAQQPAAAPGGRILLKGGCVLSLDPQIGDFDAADVLIEGTKIVAVRPNITATAEVIDATNTIVTPGFVDTHRHMWQGALRSILPDGLLSDYTRDITGTARAVMRPDDARVGDLVSALGAINAGVTTVLDWSHIGNSPAHADACIDGLRESGIRAVYAYLGSGTDIRRLRKQSFSSSD